MNKDMELHKDVTAAYKVMQQLPNGDLSTIHRGLGDRYQLHVWYESATHGFHVFSNLQDAMQYKDLLQAVNEIVHENYPRKFIVVNVSVVNILGYDIQKLGELVGHHNKELLDGNSWIITNKKAKCVVVKNIKLMSIYT